MSGRTGIRICVVCTGINIALAVINLRSGNTIMAAVAVVIAIASAVTAATWRRALGAAR